MLNLYGLVAMRTEFEYAFSSMPWIRSCVSLYKSDSAIEFAEVAPYVGGITRIEQFLEEVNTHFSISSGLVLLSSTEDVELIRAHLRKFLMVALESGALMYFRYYDPRVLRDFLPTCDSNQLRQFFGPVAAFTVQGEVDGEWLIFRLRNDKLHVGVISGLAEAVSRTTLS